MTHLIICVAGNALLLLLSCLYHREIKKERRRAFREGQDDIRKQAYPFVANCSATAHKKALIILRPDHL